MASIDDILLYQAQLDAQNNADNSTAIGLGALLGGTSGVVSGQVQESLGNALNRLKDAAAERQGLTRAGLPTGTRVREAISKKMPTVKGGIAGAVLGGLTGAIGKQLMQDESLAAELYAKRLSGEPLTAQEMAVVQQVVANTLSNNNLG
tara:strand:- start:95 stop:541 length:447 start_codon:yes stop_codon:yes gene_type:complete